MRPLSESTARVSGKICERKYIALGRIVKNWREIVGENLADKAQPVKLHFRKKKKDGEKPDARLDIAVSSAHATALHYQKGLILERINQLFGEAWISSIRFVDTPMKAQDIKPKKTYQPLTNNEKNHLSNILETVEDAEMQSRLGSLGEAIIIDQKS
ncbi:MAG: DUF721 domain-containing protein [Alphaproteobacteria bacterium]